VSECSAQGVVFGEQRLAAKVILWAAGVRASPAAAWLQAPADGAGRIKVAPDLSAPGRPDIFVVGDTATIDAWHGKPVPGIAPAAKQQGSHVADIIKRRLSGDSSPRPFRYRHSGNLATIGKRAAVIDFGRIKVRGYIAWWIWGLAHIYFLIGVRNRLAVALSWLWIYLTGTRGACLITQGPPRSEPQ
jgi:NADH dehydrogenase